MARSAWDSFRDAVTAAIDDIRMTVVEEPMYGQPVTTAHTPEQAQDDPMGGIGNSTRYDFGYRP